jgi:hypothetical protein
MAGGLANIILNIGKSRPNSNKPLIDWDLVLVMEPTTIVGALVGSYLNTVRSCASEDLDTQFVQLMPACSLHAH